MRLSLQLGVTVLVQGSGAGAALMAALLIGWVLGPQQQGQFSHVKSLIDLGAISAAIGMPQTLFVFIQSSRMSLRQGFRASLWVSLLGIPVGILIVGWSAPVLDAKLTLAVVAAVVLACLHAQWRSFVLLGDTTWHFNLVTALPQILLVPIAFWVIDRDGAEAGPVAWAMALIWLVASTYAGYLVHKLPSLGSAQSLSVRALIGHGSGTWVSISLAALAVVVVQRLARQIGGADGLGMVTMALLLAQVPMTPVNYAVPILLRHRLRTSALPNTEARLVRMTPFVTVASGTVLVLVPLVLAIGQVRSDFWLGAGYLNLDQVLACALAAAAAEVAMRIMSIDVQAEGRTWQSASAEGVRVSALLVFGAWASLNPLSFSSNTPAVLVAVVWALSSWAAALTLYGLNSGAHA